MPIYTLHLGIFYLP